MDLIFKVPPLCRCQQGTWQLWGVRLSSYILLVYFEIPQVAIMRNNLTLAIFPLLEMRSGIGPCTVTKKILVWGAFKFPQSAFRLWIISSFLISWSFFFNLSPTLCPWASFLLIWKHILKVRVGERSSIRNASETILKTEMLNISCWSFAVFHAAHLMYFWGYRTFKDLGWWGSFNNQDLQFLSFMTSV